MHPSLHNEINQLIKDFVRDLGDNIDIKDYAPYLVQLLKELELDAVHGHGKNIDDFRDVLNNFGGEIQERVNSGIRLKASNLILGLR